MEGGMRGHAGAGGFGSGRGGGTSLRRSRELAELADMRWDPYGGGCGLVMAGEDAAILESSTCEKTGNHKYTQHEIDVRNTYTKTVFLFV